MRCLSLILLFLCSVFGYTQDTLLHRDTAITAYTAKGIKLSWEKDASTKYAFDDGSNKPKELQKEYSTTKDAEGKEVFIPYKAVLNGKEDVVNAVIEITDTALNRAEVLFKTLTGKSIPVIQQYKTPNGRKYTLQLKGAYDYAIEEVMAMLVPRDSGANQQVIGSFKLVHLSPKTVNITLVPLDAQAQQKIASYKEELQKIYDSIGVSFNIKEEPVMDISSIVQGNEIESEDAELMSSYSQQQQQINAMYKGQSNERYVVFITSKRASTGQGGYMRLNGQYGYVYCNADAKTLAHEIGHGVFRLEHPWSKYKTTKNSSNLLLDYKTGGRELCHLDWKQINDPAFKLYAFQSQSEGEEPIKPLAGTVEQFKALLDNSTNKVGLYKKQQAADYLQKLSSTKITLSGIEPDQTGYFNNKVARYIYTEIGYWIDMVHFLYYAGKAYEYKLKGVLNAIQVAIQDGKIQEFFDTEHSRYSYEDLPSDRYGAMFAITYFDVNSELTFGEQIANYLNNELKATKPEKAPNYNSLPIKYPSKPTKTNTTTIPLYPQ